MCLRFHPATAVSQSLSHSNHLLEKPGSFIHPQVLFQTNDGISHIPLEVFTTLPQIQGIMDDYLGSLASGRGIKGISGNHGKVK